MTMELTASVIIDIGNDRWRQPREKKKNMAGWLVVVSSIMTT